MMSNIVYMTVGQIPQLFFSLTNQQYYYKAEDYDKLEWKNDRLLSYIWVYFSPYLQSRIIQVSRKGFPQDC